MFHKAVSISDLLRAKYLTIQGNWYTIMKVSWTKLKFTMKVLIAFVIYVYVYFYIYICLWIYMSLFCLLVLTKRKTILHVCERCQRWIIYLKGMTTEVLRFYSGTK